MLATALDVVLVPLAQGRSGNGGLGCATATAVAEVLMFIAAIRLVPADRTRLARELGKNLGRGLAGAVAMAASGMLSTSAPSDGFPSRCWRTWRASASWVGIGGEDRRLFLDMVRLRSTAVILILLLIVAQGRW